MTAFVVLVEFEIVPGKLDAFMEIVRVNAAASARDEPGCRKFDVLRDIADPARANIVTLYEIYDDEAAFDTHRTMPHYKVFSDAIQGMEASPRRVRKMTVWEDGAD